MGGVGMLESSPSHLDRGLGHHSASTALANCCCVLHAYLMTFILETYAADVQDGMANEGAEC